MDKEGNRRKNRLRMSPYLSFELQGEFESKPNCIHFLVLLHLPAWMMKQIMFLHIGRENVVKAALFYLLYVHQKVRPKSVIPWHPSLRKDYSLGTQC
jgi:hypothetical protein